MGSRAASAEVVGTVEVKPVRIGLAIGPTMDSFVRAVEHATSSWGGMYFPILPGEDAAKARSLARFFAVDVIVAVDDHEGAKSLEELPGFRWRGRSPYGALDPPHDHVTTRVLDASALIQGAAASGNAPPHLLHPRWDPADPLDLLYVACYGKYEDSDFGRQLDESFGDLAEEVSIDPDDTFRFLDDGSTPLDLTSLGVTCTSYDQELGFILLDLDDPDDLTAFWNMRADGQAVFPWPVKSENRLADAGGRWVDEALTAGLVPRPRKGTGEQGPPEVRIWSARTRELPPRLVELLEARDVKPWPSVGDAHPTGWRGGYPLTTDFEASFTSTVDDERFAIDVAVPRIDFLPRRRDPFSSGIVAAHVEIHSERRIAPGFVVACPNVRLLSSLLERYAEYPQHFQRGTGVGRVVGISADEQRLKLYLISSFSLFEKLLEASAWECSQTDDGRLSSQLIDLLGGPGSHVANQPAVREVLMKAAASHRGKPVPALVGVARNHQGTWPGPMETPDSRRDYPQRLVNYLIHRKLLRPSLPVRCPRCTAETGWSPDDLSSLLTCPMCDEQFPMGLALSLAGRRTDWLFRLAGNVPPAKLAETFPVMAALDVLGQFPYPSGARSPHVLGVRIDASGQQREVDLLVALNDRGLPVMVAGEAKSYRDEVDRRDLEVLTSLQKLFHSMNLEAFVLVATLRDSFEGSARQALRDMCERSPDRLHYSHGERLALPIALTGHDLSAHPWADEHPRKWMSPPSTLGDFAMETCRRNLGLEEVEYVRSGSARRPRFLWR